MLATDAKEGLVLYWNTIGNPYSPFPLASLRLCEKMRSPRRKSATDAKEGLVLHWNTIGNPNSPFLLASLRLCEKLISPRRQGRRGMNG
jgi:hypothetical protein